HRDLLLFLAPRDGVRLPGEVRLELFVGPQELEPLLVEAHRSLVVDLAELVPVDVTIEHGKLRLRGSQRHLLAPELDARSEDRVLELVVALRELGREQSALARLAQPVQPLSLVPVGLLLLGLQRAQLLAAEEIGVARNYRRLLGDLLFAHANGTSLFG